MFASNAKLLQVFLVFSFLTFCGPWHALWVFGEDRLGTRGKEGLYGNRGRDTLFLEVSCDLKFNELIVILISVAMSTLPLVMS